MNDEWPDLRKIEDMNFGSEWEPKLGHFVSLTPWLNGDKPEERMRDIPTQEALDAWKAEHADKLARLLALLRACDVKTADDIMALGCTGAMASGLSIEDIQFVRMGIAGGGVGLPCFVPPTLYCLAHDTIGGLQKGQKPALYSVVENISRELTPVEAGSSALVTAAMRARGEDKMQGAFEILQGDAMPADWSSATADVLLDRAAATQPSVVAASWKCTEHAQTNWSCRYCVAQAIVDGEIAQEFMAVSDHPTAGPGPVMAFASSDFESTLKEENESNVTKLVVYARVATFTRKLSRD
jgi:hypothetical protein